jgi:hypothetical protein
MLEAIGYISTVLAITGVIFNNRKMRICFYIWLISNGNESFDAPSAGKIEK